MESQWLTLPPPGEGADAATFADYARRIADTLADPADVDAVPDPPSPSIAAVHAAACILRDLAVHGWSVHAAGQCVEVRAPASESDAEVENARVRRQELLKRDEQLRIPSVRRFVAGMERPREHRGKFVSIFNLMRDGAELARALEAAAERPSAGDEHWRAAIDPYVEIVTSSARCPQTGLRLMDIWRYFRHTWTNQYTSTPGRTMTLLIRDRAAEFHPVIGIAALASAIVQIDERDAWLGWQPKSFLDRLQHEPPRRAAHWVVRRIERWRDEIYVDDLCRDGLYWPDAWHAPTQTVIDRLATEARARRQSHHRFVRQGDFKQSISSEDWQARAETDLFRSKRCVSLAELLRVKLALLPYLYPSSSSKGLAGALENVDARRAISTVLRRAKAESVGTAIADLTVCGAVPPYTHILGGKLVSMLATSPHVAREYEAKYRDSPSQIASSVAGRPIARDARLAYIGTTSLYGGSSSQYNRVRIPREVLGGRSDVRFVRLGRSRSFGTSHLSSETVRALVSLTEQSKNGVRVNSIFGEGVNPKLRKIRGAVDLLGWPSDELLRHRRERIVYGVALVDNLLPFLLGLDANPRYLWDARCRRDVDRIAAWWFERWLAARSARPDVLAAVAAHSVHRPGAAHGARVALPTPQADDIEDKTL